MYVVCTKLISKYLMQFLEREIEPDYFTVALHTCMAYKIKSDVSVVARMVTWTANHVFQWEFVKYKAITVNGDQAMFILSPKPQTSAQFETILLSHHSYLGVFSTRLEMEKWMEDLNMAIEMAKQPSEISDRFLENSISNHSNSE